MVKSVLSSVLSRDNSAKDESTDRQKELSFKAATVQIVFSSIASLSVLSTGIGLGYPAITSQLLLDNENDFTLTASQVSWFASITAIACPIGGPISGFLSDKIGRRNTLVIISIIATASWLIIGFSSRDNKDLFFIQLMIGRFIMGVAIGMITTPAIMYTSEVVHPNLRGKMTVMSTPFFVSFGTLVAYFLGYLIPVNFRLVALISAGITVATFLILFFIPESPAYLVAKNKINKAEKALTKMRNLNKNDEKLQNEIEKYKESQSTSKEKTSFLALWKEFAKPELYKPFLIMLAFFFLQQFSGIFVIFVYAAQFSIEAGITLDAFLSAVIIGAVRTLTTILVAFVSDYYGRRPLTLFSGIGMFCSMLGLTISVAFSLNEGNLSWLSATFLYTFIFTGTFGILTLPFAMVAEMYPQKTRGFAAGITMSLAFLMSFANIKTFQSVFEIFGNVSVFSFYTFVSFLGILFAIFVLPETKGKTLSEIEEHFRKK